MTASVASLDSSWPWGAVAIAAAAVSLAALFRGCSRLGLLRERAAGRAGGPGRECEVFELRRAPGEAPGGHERGAELRSREAL